MPRARHLAAPIIGGMGPNQGLLVESWQTQIKANSLSHSVTIVSIVRLVYVITTVNFGEADTTGNIENTVIWSAVEVNTAVLCGQ